jgi:putative addiction module component (TIGR02574 family)
VADRLTLRKEIWDSITENPDQIPSTAGQKSVLDSRLAELDTNPNDVLMWDEIRARVPGQR